MVAALLCLFYITYALVALAKQQLLILCIQETVEGCLH